MAAANTSIFTGWIVLPNGTNAPPNNVVKLVSDNASIAGLVLNVPSGSTNGWTFAVNGTSTAAEIFPNGIIFAVNTIEGQSFQTNSGTWVVNSGGNETATTMSSSSTITAAGTISSGANVTAAGGMSVGANLVVTGDITAGGSMTATGAISGNGVSSTNGFSGNGYASTSGSPGFTFPNSAGGSNVTWIGHGSQACNGITASGFYLATVGAGSGTASLVGDGADNIGVCGGLYATSLHGDGSAITGIVLPNVPVFASGSCTVPGGSNSCTVTLNRNLGSTYTCATMLGSSGAIDAPSSEIVSGTQANFQFSTVESGVTINATCMTMP